MESQPASSRVSVETDADLYENNRVAQPTNQTSIGKKTKALRQNSPQSTTQTPALQKGISPQIKIVKENETESKNTLNLNRNQSNLLENFCLIQIHFHIYFP